MQPIAREQTFMPQPVFDRNGDDADFTLMASIRSGDEKAFAALYERYSGVVYSLCLRMLQDAGQAEDCLVDVFWELWERRSRFDASRGRPLPHILGLTRSRATDRLRSRRAMKRNEPAPSRLSDVDEPTAERRQPLDNVLWKERQRRIAGAMATLPPEQREALELAFFGAMSHAQVARSLGQPLGTIKSRIRQALIRLHDVLEDWKLET